MSTLARKFCTRLPPMEGVADACATDQNARSSSLESMDHQALQTRRQHLRRPRAARTLDALGQALRAPLRAAVADTGCGAPEGLGRQEDQPPCSRRGRPCGVPRCRNEARLRGKGHGTGRQEAQGNGGTSAGAEEGRAPDLQRGQPPRDLRPGRRLCCRTSRRGRPGDDRPRGQGRVQSHVHGRRLVESCEEIRL